MSALPFDFSQYSFSPVIDLPSDYEVFDFTHGYDPNRPLKSAYGIGRYDEKRPGMYATNLFQEAHKPRRDIHVGIDIAAPVGTPVRAFFAGRLFMVGINSAPGDYGGTLITEHCFADRVIWALFGHLSHQSVECMRSRMEVGAAIEKGEVIGWIGDRSENGGWNPHLHFQLSWRRPDQCDLPGVVSDEDRAQALAWYPDPRCVLGPLY